jgi:hypothetical protein
MIFGPFKITFFAFPKGNDAFFAPLQANERVPATVDTVARWGSSRPGWLGAAI